MKIRIHEYTNPMKRDSILYRAVIDLVRLCSNDLSMFIYDKESLLYDYLEEREAVRGQMLLDKVGAVDINKKHFIVAECENTGQFLGFAISSPFIDRGTSDVMDGTSITMIAVVEEARSKGVFTGLIEYVKGRFKGVTLTCSPSLTPLYEKFGFTAVGYFQTHICMNYGTIPEAGCLVSIDDEIVIGHSAVLSRYKSLVATFGDKALSECIMSWQRDFTEGEKVAQRYFNRKCT